MLNEEHPPVTWRELRAAREFLGLSPRETWVAYFGVGGCGTVADIDRWLSGDVPIPETDYNFLAVGLNEVFLDRGLGSAIRYLDG